MFLNIKKVIKELEEEPEEFAISPVHGNTKGEAMNFRKCPRGTFWKLPTALVPSTSKQFWVIGGEEEDTRTPCEDDTREAERVEKDADIRVAGKATAEGSSRAYHPTMSQEECGCQRYGPN
ncbi:hypothetical protein NDU88_001635 [Pleurodeles waltl]|uniref:Uncharacterized protein n=1 Tax=Pleurodeles waltl TaxID=8319 RepID=A0AAV7NFB2_PLEWA|nr:hypothetical protein NDU88_001635 [Pleurodeles waltl]